MSVRFGFGLDELRGAEAAGELHKKASDDKEHKYVQSETLHKEEEKILREPDIPGTYRGWNLNKRGENRKGEAIFNLTKKADGRKRQKYLGIWNQEKADRIIDETERQLKP